MKKLDRWTESRFWSNLAIVDDQRETTAEHLSEIFHRKDQGKSELDRIIEKLEGLSAPSELLDQIKGKGIH